MKNTIGMLVAAALLLFVPAAADARAKHWYSDPKWWAGEILIGAAVAADGATTARGLAHGGVETNPLLGPGTASG